MQVGLFGSPKIEGVGRTSGMNPAPGRSGSPAIMNVQQTPAVKRAAILWGLALAVLVLFHVGGASLD